MKIEINQTTLIDQVEDSLLTYFKKNDLGRGDSIPNENSLAAELGVARSVVREALSRLKMMGLIHARPRKGMVLTEPSILGGMKRVIDPRVLSEETILDLLDFRIALEIGIQKYTESNRKIFVIRGIANGMETSLTFKKAVLIPRNAVMRE